MERYTYKLIPVDAVKAENPFCLRFSLKEPALEKSIAKYGIVMPVFATGLPDIRVVDGHRRVEAALACGLKEIPAFELQGNFSNTDLFFLALIANSSQGFSDVDRLWVLKKAIHEFQCSKKKIIEEILPLLGLRQESFILEEYLSAAKLDSGLIVLLAAKKIPFRCVQRLKRFNEADQKAMAVILGRASFTTNEVLHICEWVGDLLAPRGKSISDFFGENDLKIILEHPVWDSRCKAEKFYEALRYIRSPHLAASEKKFKSLAREICEDAPDVKIQALPSFEEEGFSLQAKIRNAESLEQFLNLLNGKKSSLNSLFDLML